MYKYRKTTWFILAIFICTIAFGSIAPQAFAACRDISGHWAKPQIEFMIEHNIIAGYEDNTFKPEKRTTRAEFMVMTNKTFGFTGNTAISFSDVKSSDWFATEIVHAVAAGYISGYADGTIRPNQPISRQEVAVIIAKILSLKPSSNSSLNKLSDNKTIDSWSKDAIAAVLERSYMSGYPDKSFKPANSITRAEVATILRNVYGKRPENIYTEPVIPGVQSKFDTAGTYGPESGKQVITGDVTISAAGVTLRNTQIKGDLLLAKSIGEGNVTLKNVTVEGTTEINGGGAHSITLQDCVLPKINVDKDGVRVVATGNTSVKTVTLDSGAVLVEVTLSGTGFETVVITKQVPAGSEVDLQGKFTSVTVSANVDLNIGTGSSVTTLTLNSKATVTGKGSIGTAKINANGVTIDQKPGTTIVASGITATVDGDTIHGTGNTTGGGGAAGSDTTAPSFRSGYPDTAFVGPTSLDLLVKINEDGTAYYVVLPNGASAPSASEVKAGQNASGATVSSNLRGSFSLTEDIVASETISGLASSTSYDIYVVAKDAASIPNLQSSPTKVDVTTDPASPGTLSFSAANYTVAEDGSSVTISVNRTGGSSGAASVQYATSNGSATAGSDYTAASGTLSWSSGSSVTKTFTVSITDDGAIEGNESFTVTLSNTTGASLGAQNASTVTITDNDSAALLAIGTSNPPNASQNQLYGGYTFTASGGTAPYSFAVTAGALPAGMNLAAGGALSGTPTANGTFNFTVTVTDNASATDAHAFTLEVSAAPVPLAIGTSNPPNASQNQLYGGYTFTASGGTAPYTFAVTSGALPAGMSLAAGGALSGTPTASGTFNFTVTVTDNASATDAHAFTMDVSAAPVPLAIGTTNPPNASQNQAYAGHTFTASGGTAPYTFAVTSGALPAGMSLAAGGALSGTPTVNGTFNFTVTVTDSASATDAHAFTMDVSAAQKAWTIMVYSDADNNLEGSLLGDIQEMKNGVTDKVNLIVLIDRKSGGDGDSSDSSVLGEDFADTRLYEITPGTATRIAGGTQFTNIPASGPSTEYNMGDANTLEKLIEFGKQNYSADHYAVVLSNHGGGTRAPVETLPLSRDNNEKAICWDDSNGGDCLYIAEFSDILDSGDSVDFLGFDACLMGTAEVAYQFRPGNGSFAANVLVASAPNEWGDGWDYENSLSRLQSSGGNNGQSDTTMGGNELYYNPVDMTALQLGGIFVEEQHDSCIAAGYGANQSLSCFDLDKAASVKTAVDALAVAMASNNEKADFENIRGSLSTTNTMEYFNQNDINDWYAYPYFDLYDLCSKVSNSPNFGVAVKNASNSVMSAVDNMVVCSYGGTDYTGFQNGRNGLSIFFPDGDRIADDGNASTTDPYLWSYEWWYNSIDTNAWWSGGHYYGKLKWCTDGRNLTANTVGNWFEMLDAWFEEGGNAADGGYNGFQW